jgi:hypothetical protein
MLLLNEQQQCSCSRYFPRAQQRTGNRTIQQALNARLRITN